MDISTALQPLKALFTNRTFVTALLSAIVAILVGLIPTIAPYQNQIISVGVALVLLSAGGEAVANATKPTADAKIEAAKAEAAMMQAHYASNSTALNQGESLKSYQPFDFSEAELRAIAYRLGALPPGDISRDGLVMAILAVLAPKAAT